MTEEENRADLVSQELHLRKILVPTDFSGPSEYAVRYALRLAKHFHADITLLTVVEKTAINRHRDAGYTGWKHACLGSTAEHMTRTAPCPVFVVREKQHEFI